MTKGRQSLGNKAELKQLSIINPDGPGRSTEPITEKEVRQIQTQFPKLEELHLLGAGRVEPGALKLLMRQESLKRVVILDAPSKPSRDE